MRIELELNEEETARLRAAAERLRLTPEELAHAILLAWLSRAPTFQTVADYVLAKNRELYQRLAE